MFKMTPNIIKNICSKYATRLYPLEVREPFEGVRGNLDVDIEQCIFCKKCMLKCPSGCITVDKKTRTWEVDPYACVYCGICVDNCPTKCLSMSPKYRKPALQKDFKRAIQRDKQA
jgi:formate hydrogenlyase subunit 6/NADH:ubiquinone oxidoreductase subunit I